MLLDLQGETTLECEADDGSVSYVHFRSVYFFQPVILYTYPYTDNIGIIQEDNEEEWSLPIHEVWMDITDQCGWRPFITD